MSRGRIAPVHVAGRFRLAEVAAGRPTNTTIELAGPETLPIAKFERILEVVESDGDVTAPAEVTCRNAGCFSEFPLCTGSLEE